MAAFGSPCSMAERIDVTWFIATTQSLTSNGQNKAPSPDLNLTESTRSFSDPVSVSNLDVPINIRWNHPVTQQVSGRFDRPWHHQPRATDEVDPSPPRDVSPRGFSKLIIIVQLREIHIE
jgi:hypothetical protein